MAETKSTRNIVETKNHRNDDLTKNVVESMGRLHELERRIHTLQGEIASLSSLAGGPSQRAPTPPSPIASGDPYGLFAGATIGSPYLGASSAPLSIPTYSGTPLAMAPPFVGRAGPTLAASSPIFGLASASPSFAEQRTTRDLQSLPPQQRAPEANLVDIGDHFVLQVELPGVKKDELEILVSERTITLKADARHELADGTVLLGEVVPVQYRRTIGLPASCNTAQTKATLKDGFLTLKVPKVEPTESPRRIDAAYG